ncbi:bifunctional nuclease family protein [Amycolatopsis cihanbeyliensis]|uniref:bifunctional nuclease family protein n=1 Tax=Amycolatopsis cihanbeyliensis TaxID=1128664 RepID=UPI001FE9CC51|nr:bifunctional nuclease family protein [Amycolatopsis cihanbeyliensis]
MSFVVPVHLHGVVTIPARQSPVMLLRETGGERRWLAVPIAESDAEALLSAKEHVRHSRPSTVELLGRVLAEFGHQIVRVQVTDLHEDTFQARLVLDTGAEIPAHPSDAIAIGLRAGAPTEVAEAVLDVAAVQLSIIDDTARGPSEDEDEEHQIAEFRALLESAVPADFDDLPER